MANGRPYVVLTVQKVSQIIASAQPLASLHLNWMSLVSISKKQLCIAESSNITTSVRKCAPAARATVSCAYKQTH